MKRIWKMIKKVFLKMVEDNKYGWLKPIPAKPAYKGDPRPTPFEAEVSSAIGYALFNREFHPTEEERKDEDKFHKAAVNAVNKTTDHINKMDIVGIDALQNLDESIYVITITLGRPGIFIGVKGELIDYITEHLSATLKKKVAIRLKEDRVINRIYGYQSILNGFFGNDYY